MYKWIVLKVYHLNDFFYRNTIKEQMVNEYMVNELGTLWGMIISPNKKTVLRVTNPT